MDMHLTSKTREHSADEAARKMSDEWLVLDML